MYNQKVMERFKNQKFLGEIRSANAIGYAGDTSMGDIVKFYLVVEDGKITAAKAKVFGCVASVAVASQTAEMLEGLSIEEAVEFDMSKVEEELGGIPAEKSSILITSKQAIIEAMNYYFKKLEK